MSGEDERGQNEPEQADSHAGRPADGRGRRPDGYPAACCALEGLMNIAEAIATTLLQCCSCLSLLAITALLAVAVLGTIR